MTVPSGPQNPFGRPPQQYQQQYQQGFQQGYPQYGAAAGAPAMPPAPTGRGARSWLVIAVAAVAVIALVAGGLVWWQSRGDDGAAGPVPGQLTAEFPTVPRQAWKVTPGQVGASEFVSPNPSNGQYGTPGGVTDGDYVLTGTRGDGVDSVVGIGPNGTPWAPNIGLTCAAQVVDARTACRRARTDDPTIYFLDLAGRRVDQHTATLGEGFGLLSLNHSGAFESTADEVRKFTESGEAWHRPSPMPTSPGGDFHSSLATDALVGFYYGGSVKVVSAADGSPITSRVGSPPQALPDGGMVLGGQHDQDAGLIIHPDGSTTDIGHGAVSVPTVTSPDMSGALLVAGELRLPDGSSPWSRPIATASASPSPDFPVLTSRVAVVQTDSGYSGFDAATGAPLWTAPKPGVPSSTIGAITDGSRLIYVGEAGTIIAIDLTTGEQVWSLDAGLSSSGSNSVGYARLLAVGDDLVVITNDGVTGYRGTGGAAHAPGAAAGDSDSDSGDEYFTRCGSAPVFTPERFRTETGGLVVTMKVTATCPGGDALTAAGTRITVRDDTGTIADGVFDFAATPVGIPGSESGGGAADGEAGTSVDLTFGQGHFFRLPDTLPTASGSPGGTGTAGSSGHRYLVDCDRPDGGAEGAPAPSGTAPSLTADPAPMTGSGAVDGRSALRIQADSDRAFILSGLNNHWVAQLSSKRPGLVADGRTWDENAILDEFLGLRLRFSDVRLLYSNEWPVFSEPGWWVTVAAATFPGPDQANAWCRTQGFDHDHCFAKLVSSTAGPEGSTRYW